MAWMVPEIWKGGTAWILGGGPSLPRQFGVPEETIQDVTAGLKTPADFSPYMSNIHHRHVIGINMAYMMGDWIDIVFFSDTGFLLKNEDNLKACGSLKVSCLPRTSNLDWCKFLIRDSSHRIGISPKRNKVSWNQNSGMAAISLASHLGVKRIMLLGFDMTMYKGTQHWHGYYLNNGKQADGEKAKSDFARHMKGLKMIVRDAAVRGIEIINVSPESAINTFPKMSLQEALEYEKTKKSRFSD